jgi:hypothetical protein
VAPTKGAPPKDLIAKSFEARAENPSDGVTVTYFLQDTLNQEARLTFLDGGGKVIRAYSSEDTGEAKLPADKGVNRFIWDMRYPGARGVPETVIWDGDLSGPIAVPGHYTVQLTVGKESRDETFEILGFPDVPTNHEEYQAQFALHAAICDKLSMVHDAVNQIREIRQQLEMWLPHMRPTTADAAVIRETADRLKDKLSSVEEELIQVRAKVRDDPIAFPVKLNNKLAALKSTVANSDSPPTKQSYDVFADLSRRIDAELHRLAQIVDEDIADFNAMLHKLKVPAIGAGR